MSKHGEGGVRAGKSGGREVSRIVAKTLRSGVLAMRRAPCGHGALPRVALVQRVGQPWRPEVLLAPFREWPANVLAITRPGMLHGFA